MRRSAVAAMALLLSGAIAADAFSLRGLRDYFSHTPRATRSLQQSNSTGWPAVELSSSAVFVSMYEVREAPAGASAMKLDNVVGWQCLQLLIRCIGLQASSTAAQRVPRRNRPLRRRRLNLCSAAQVTPQSGNGKENYLWCWDQIDKAKATNSKAIQIVPTSEPP
jgi:hypothetical protein